MLRFLAHRLLLGLVVLWIVSVAVFVLFFVTPHDPARLIAGRLATPQTVALVNHRLGLDRPLPDQYGGFVWRALHGDLGYSYYSSAPVRQLVASRLPVTVSLVLGAAVLWLVLGVGVGVAAARRPRSVTDRVGTVFVLTGLSMPTFLVGLLLINFCSSACTSPASTCSPPAATSPSARTRSGGPSTCSSPGSPWPWSSPPPTRG
jgi:peptide/nickel transport system permease protein